MPTRQEIENLVFEVLGDFVDPKKDVEIDELRNGSFRIIVLRSYGVPKEIFWEDWKRATEGKEGFDKVNLFV